MKKSQFFSADGSMAIVFFISVIMIFLFTWNIQNIFASDSFENNLLEIKSFDTLDLLLSNPELGVVSEYYDISYYKLSNMIDELNNDNYNTSERLGLAGYDIVLRMQYAENNSIILSSFDTISSYKYRLTASKNCLFEGDNARLLMMVSRI